MQIQAPIKRAYALTLYEFLNDELHRSQVNAKTINLSLGDLRMLFDLNDGQYSEYKHLNNQAIKPAFAEINEHTDIVAEYHNIRTKRRVSGLYIQAKRQKKYQFSINFSDSHTDEQAISEIEAKGSDEIKLLSAYGISIEKAEYLVSRFSIQQIISNLNYSLEQYEKQKVAHFPSFLIKAIENNYTSSLSKVDHQNVIKDAWNSYRSRRCHELFLALPDNVQSQLKKDFEQSFRQNPEDKITQQKFQYDGGWDSQWVQQKFRREILINLLESPEETNFDDFSKWWERQEIKKMIDDSKNIVRRMPDSA